MGKHFGGFVDGRPVPGGATVSPAKGGKSKPEHRVIFAPRCHGKSRLGAMVAALFTPGAIQRPAPMGDSEGKTLPDNEPGTIWTGPAVGLQNVANAEPTGTRACSRDGLPCVCAPDEPCPNPSAISRIGRRAMADTQASRDAHYEAIKAEAMAGACPSCGSAEHRLCGVVMAEDERKPADPFAPIEDPTASMTGLVGRTGPFSGPSPEHLQRLAETRAELAARAEAAIDRLAEVAAEAAEEEPCDWPSCDCEKSSACGAMTARVRTAIAAEAQALNAAAPLQAREAGDVRGGEAAAATWRASIATGPAAGFYEPDWQRNAIEAAQTLATEHRVIAHRAEPNNAEVICPACAHQFRAIPVDVQRLLTDAGVEPPFIAHRVESERERRERLLAEWAAHREAAPMEPGRVPGEPMPRDEADLVAQAWHLLGPDAPQKWDATTMQLLFSMALTYCQQERRPFYEEHDGNRLVHSMVRSARGMSNP